MMTKLSGANMRDVIQWIIEKNNNKEYVKVKIWFLQMMLEELDRLEEQQAEPKDTTIPENRQKLEQQAEEEWKQIPQGFECECGRKYYVKYYVNPPYIDTFTIRKEEE